MNVTYLTYASAVALLSDGDCAIRDLATGTRYTDGGDLTAWDNQLAFWIEAAQTELAAGGAGGTVTQGPGNDGSQPWVIGGPDAPGTIPITGNPVLMGYKDPADSSLQTVTGAPATYQGVADLKASLDNAVNGETLATETTLQAALTALGDAGDVAGASTVIGLLKQIVINTTIVP